MDVMRYAASTADQTKNAAVSCRQRKLLSYRELLDRPLSDHPGTIQSSVFQPAAEASFVASNLVAGATEPSGD